jgi:hypothetical protein
MRPVSCREYYLIHFVFRTSRCKIAGMICGVGNVIMCRAQAVPLLSFGAFFLSHYLISTLMNTDLSYRKAIFSCCTIGL